MKRILLLLAIVVSSATSYAQTTYIAFEQITIAGTAIGLTAATINHGGGHLQANRAVCRLQDAQIRYRVDGTAPTSTVGTPLEIGDVLELTGNEPMNAFRAIRTGGTSGVLNCHYFAP